MKSKILKTIALCFASAMVIGSVGAFAGCKPETAHPEVRISYEFNGETYAVEYKLYRNMYPHTVRHFIELSENGFYDGMIIHNYQTNDWFTGAYNYDETEYSANVDNAGQMREYFDKFSKEQAYNDLYTADKLSASVYGNINADGKVIESTKLPTVMGEYYNNIRQEIEKGALTADYGCLKMFYYTKQSTQKIYVTPTKDQTILADYKNNCATSVFAVQTGSSSTYSETNYTVFASLKSTETFDDFVAAVKKYIDDNYSGTASNFYTANVEARVDNMENFSNKLENDKGITASFNVPKQPIKVTSVKVTKY